MLTVLSRSLDLVLELFLLVPSNRRRDGIIALWLSHGALGDVGCELGGGGWDGRSKCDGFPRRRSGA